ncbi:MAG: hypothetical protein KME32_35255 [Mojavia pulchra JT2-VF2]|uniref:Uncharacterized protein n=1 Tax=Mojavia pulchra JT2-VF2 TaxID=287848 RepID=A0A951UK25_9NOST|nr:hypothetical protein [Mojavia pulchra JT2-VF2]
MLKLIALFSGLLVLGGTCGYFAAEYQKGNIKAVNPNKTDVKLEKTDNINNSSNNNTTIVTPKNTDNKVLEQKIDNQKYIREQVKADVLAELENQRVAIAKQKEVERQAILQQQRELYLKHQLEQARITSLQNKCLENKLEATKEVNKIKESLVDSGDNMFTQFADAQIEAAESKRDTEYMQCLQNIK